MTSTQPINAKSIKKSFGLAFLFYGLIALEFFYMASPFAIYFYAIYRPGINLIINIPGFAWLGQFFLPHIVRETANWWIDRHNLLGAILAIVGFTLFCWCAGQVYYCKLTKKGAVTKGMYRFIRHPQYAALIICSLGCLLLWPRYLALLMFVTMLFAYYLLARVEEQECERKFGEVYRAYRHRTNMFLPVPIPWSKPDGLSRFSRIGILCIVYLLCVFSSLSLGRYLQRKSMNSLYTRFAPASAYISLSRMTADRLEKIVQIVEHDSTLQKRIIPAQAGSGLHYIMPANWYVSEIPMHPIDYENHFLRDTTQESTVYKIIFCRLAFEGNGTTMREKILKGTATTPLLEAEIDVALQRIVGIQEPLVSRRYPNMVMPVM